MLAYDEERGTTGYYTVTAVLVHEDPVIEYLTIDGERLETTPEHPFYTQEEWVEAGSLWLGAHVRKADGSYGVVQSIELLHRPQVMYNLTVAEAHTFFVGDQQWLVHNTCGKPTWPKTADKMDRMLGFPGTRIQDLPGTPGRNKVIWQPSKYVKITYEAHPYHPNAPRWHRKPHWHLDTPGRPHQRYLPGQHIPGY